MSLFDLLFLVAALTLVIGLIRIAVLLARARTSAARVAARHLAMAVASYFIVIAAVSLVTPQRIVAGGMPQCFDDWCIAVTGSRRIAATPADTLVVELTLSSRARGVAQGERDVQVHLIDDGGRRYPALTTVNATPLSIRLPPLGRITTERRFSLPSAARHTALVVTHDWFPHCCIIGDRESLMHRATIVPVD